MDAKDRWPRSDITVLPSPPTPSSANAEFIGGGNEMRARTHGHDWGATPLGPLDA